MSLRSTTARLSAAVLVLLVAGSQSAPSSLQYGDGTGVASGIGLVVDRAGEPQSVGAISLCSRSRGPAEIVSVSFVRGSGLEITEWSVRAGNRGGLGSSSRSLAEEGFPLRPAQVEVQCPDVDGGADVPAELALTVVAEGPDPATGSELLVTYRQGSQTAHLVIPFEVKVCRPATATSCQDG